MVPMDVVTFQLSAGYYRLICPNACDSFKTTMRATVLKDMKVESTSFDVIRIKFGAADLVVPAYFVWLNCNSLRTVIRPCLIHIGSEELPVILFGPFPTRLAYIEFRWRFRDLLTGRRVYNRRSMIKAHVTTVLI